MLAKKLSRRIDVDGDVYRWMIRGRGEPKRLTVQSEGFNGRVLIAYLVDIVEPNQSSSNGGPYKEIAYGSGFVCEIIRGARVFGWRPDLKGNSFSLHVSREGEISQYSNEPGKWVTV